MPLNYSKWDQLELSDDSDIEGHPNVDKRSLIRWKQRDIHEKRDARRHKIDALTTEIACNSVLHPRLLRIRQRIAGAPATALGDLAEDADAGQSHTGLPFFQYLVDRLQSSPSPAAPPTNAQNQPTYDAMILSLLFQIYDTIKVLPQDEQEKAVLDGMATHIAQLSDHSRKLEADLEAELAEQKKHITSDDIHEGWESKVSHPPQPAYNTDPLSSTFLPNPPRPRSRMPLRIQRQEPRRRQHTKYSTLPRLLQPLRLPTTTSSRRTYQSSRRPSLASPTCPSGTMPNPLPSYRAIATSSSQVHPTRSLSPPSRQRTICARNMQSNACTRACFCNTVTNWAGME